MAFRIDDDENRIQDLKDQIDQLEVQTFSPEVVARNESTRNTGIQSGDSAASNPYPQWIPIRDFGTQGNITLVIDLNRVDSHIAKMTINGDTDFAFSFGPGTNKMMQFILDVTIDATGGFTLNLLNNILPAGITIDNTANARTVIRFTTTDGGTTYYAEDLTTGGVSSNVPDPTAEFQHLQSDGANNWIAQQELQFGIQSADVGSIRNPNDIIGIAWRNSSNTENLTIRVDTTNKFIFGIGAQDVLEISSAQVNFKSLDAIEIDRLQFVQDSGALISVDNPTIYVNNIGNGDLVINNRDTEAILFTHSNIIGLQETTTVLQKQGENSNQFIRLVNLKSPISVGDLGAFEISALTSGFGQLTMAFFSGRIETIAGAGRGSAAIGINLDGAFTNFIAFNESNNDQVDIFKETDFNSQDVIKINRLQLVGGTPSATSVNDVVWYLSSAGDLVSNINASDGWIWSSGNITKMVLTDDTLEKRNVTAPSFQLFNTRAPQVGTAGVISILANSANILTGVAMGFIISDTEVQTGDGSGSLKLGVNLNGTATNLITLNDNNDGLVNFQSDISLNTNSILLDVDGDTLIHSLTDDNLHIEVGGVDVITMVTGGIFMSVPLSMLTLARITDVQDPINPQDVVTKAFGDANYSTSFIGFAADADLDMNTFKITNVDQIGFRILGNIIEDDINGLIFKTIPGDDFTWSDGTTSFAVLDVNGLFLNQLFIQLTSISSPGPTGSSNVGEIFMDSANSDHLSIIRNAGVIDLESSGGEINTASNVGTGLGKVFKTKSGVDLQFKSILAGQSIEVVNGTDDVQLNVINADVVEGIQEAEPPLEDETVQFDFQMFISNSKQGYEVSKTTTLQEDVATFVPIYLGKRARITHLGFVNIAGGTGTITFAMGLYANRTDGQNYPGSLVVQDTSATVTALTQTALTNSLTPTNLEAGLYWIGMIPTNIPVGSLMTCVRHDSAGANSAGYFDDEGNTDVMLSLLAFVESETFLPSTPANDMASVVENPPAFFARFIPNTS